MTSPSDATSALRGEVFSALGQFMLGAMLTEISTPHLLDRLKTPHPTWHALVEAANTEPEDLAAITTAGIALAAFLGPDLDAGTQEQLGTLLAAMTLKS